MKTPKSVFLIFIALSSWGCGSTPDDTAPSCGPTTSPNGVSLNGVSLNGVSLNGVSLNGVSLNGVSLNGVSLNGVSLNGVSLNGVSLNGVSLNGVSLNGSELAAVTADGTPLSGPALSGALFSGQLSDGRTIELRVDGSRLGDAPDDDVRFYTVAIHVDQGWQSLCGVDEALSPVEAVALGGRWSYESGVSGGGSHIADAASMTFACAGFALEKCVILGYKPWKSMGGTSLSPLHQACTRLLRADYCGDGQSWTVDGTPVDLYDSLGIQVDTEDWFGEAEWTEDGARCVTRLRIKDGPTPSCFEAKHAIESCGDLENFSGTTRLMSEIDRAHACK